MMKNLLLMILLFGGFCLSTAEAQTCPPCPPGCCLVKCSPGTGAVSANLNQDATQSAFTCTPEQIAACLAGKKMTKKEIKECQKACTTQGQINCVAPAATAKAKGNEVDRKYHQAPNPQKS